MGEIIEIIDPAAAASAAASEENKEEKDGHYLYGYASSINNNGNGSAGGILTKSFMEELMTMHNHNQDSTANDATANTADSFVHRQSKELLLQKQRQLQSMHSQQNQDLLHKQKKDW